MKLSYTPEGVSEETGLSRTRVFSELKAGNLKARKVGGRTIILGADLQAYLDALPERQTQAAA